MERKKGIVIFGAVLIIAVCVFGLRYPYSVGLFLPLTLMLGILFFLLRNRISFEKSFIPFLVVGLMYILPFLVYQNEFRGVVRRDITNMLTLCLLGFLLFALIKRKEEFQRFYTWTGWGIILVTFITSVIGLIKFHFLMKNQILGAFDFPPEDYPWGSSLVTDYNYFALGGLAGLLACIFFYRNCNVLSRKIFLVSAGLVITLSILLSGSRRGIMILAVVLSLLLLYILSRFLGGKLSFRTKILSGLALFISLVSAIFYFHYAYKISIQEKKDFATSLGYDTVEMPRAFARLTFRYSTILKPNIRQSEIYYFFLPQEMWNTEKPKKNLYEQRSEKWAYAIRQYRSYPVVNKLFGHGFAYVKLFADRFVKEENAEDYPHNYLLSALLYSGLLGVVVILCFMLMVIYLYARYLNRFPLFASLFVLTQMFAITSGNSLFSEKFTTLFLIFPFLIYSAYLAEKYINCSE